MTGEHVATVTISPSTTSSQAVHAVLTAALERARLLRPVEGSDELVGHAVALYNPYTTHVAYADASGHVVFVPDGALPVDGRGVPAVISGPSGQRVLESAMPSGAAAEHGGRESGHLVAVERQVGADLVARAMASYA